MSVEEPLDIRKTVQEFPGVRAFSGLENAWHWTAQGGRFNFVLALTSDGCHALQVNTRGYFDATLVRSALAFSLKHEPRVLKAAPLTIMNGLSAQGAKFDTVVAVAPAIHELYKAENPRLHDVTYRIFPAYRCEFSGRETPKEAVLRTAKMVDPANLNREPQPVVRIRYFNPRTKGRTLGDNRGLVTPMVLFGEVKKLENTPDGFVEVENYLGQVRKVTWDGTFVLWNRDSSERVGLEDLLKWLHKFILEGATD